jgi:hypothetical protein
MDVVENASGLRSTCNRNEDTTNRPDDSSPVFRRDRSSGTPLGFVASVRVFPLTEVFPNGQQT